MSDVIILQGTQPTQYLVKPLLLLSSSKLLPVACNPSPYEWVVSTHLVLSNQQLLNAIPQIYLFVSCLRNQQIQTVNISRNLFALNNYEVKYELNVFFCVSNVCTDWSCQYAPTGRKYSQGVFNNTTSVGLVIIVNFLDFVKV